MSQARDPFGSEDVVSDVLANTTAAPASAHAAVPVVGSITSHSMAEDFSQAQTQNRRNVVKVSRENNPFRFYVRLAKKSLADHEEVEISGLGLAIVSAVELVEFLKNRGYITVSRMDTSYEELPIKIPNGNAEPTTDRKAKRTLSKPKIQIWIKKSNEFDDLVQKDKIAKKNARKRHLKQDPNSTNTVNE